jgi:hypothetical protein
MFDDEAAWLADRNDQWAKLRKGQVDEDELARRGSLSNHPDIDEVPYESRGWEIAQGNTGPRKRLSVLVRRHGDHYERISPPVRSVSSPGGPDSKWRVTQEGEGPMYERRADSLLDAVRVADTSPKAEHLMSEDPFRHNPDSSEAQYARTSLKDMRDKRLWTIGPIGRRSSRESRHRAVGSVSRAGDSIWR